MTTRDELLAEATQNYALAHHYLSKLKVTLDKLSAAHSGTPQASRPPVRCVREWQDWLDINGPTIKGDIQEATGVRFTERGTPYTVEWTPALAQEPDDRFAPHTLMKINTKADGRGAPPKIFFLWSQRWDVHPLFGVGPIKPEDWGEEATVAAEEIGPIEYEWSLDEPVDNSSPPEEPERYDSVEEWNEAWAPLFDTLVATEAKPSDEWRQALLDTLPDGVVDGGTHIALAYAAAVKRAREPQTLLGVIHPPPSES
jgi:hypothetical protein